MAALKESANAAGTVGPDKGDPVDSMAPTDSGTPADNGMKGDADSTNNFFPGGMFGGWTMPDINTVTEGIGGMFGEYSGETEQTESVGMKGDSDAKSDQNEVFAKKAHDIAVGASKEIQGGYKAAQETIGKAAEEIGKGWVNLNYFLDDMLTPGRGSGDENGSLRGSVDIIKEGDNAQGRFHELFPELDSGEDVVDHYATTLLQKYRCFLNNATPEKTLPLRGRLFVTTSSLAMYVADDGGIFNGSTFNIAVSFAEIARVQKGANFMMRVITKDQTSFIFADFESETHFTGALSLLEHMIESSSAQLETAETTADSG